MLAEAAELGGLDDARQEAARRVGKPLQDYAAKIWTGEVLRMGVTDDAGLILFVLMISATKSVATSEAAG